MRTTVDINPRLLARAKRLAGAQGTTVSAIVDDALAAYLGSRRAIAKDPPFALLVRGSPRGRFPTAAEMIAAEEEEDMAALAIPRKARRAAP